MIHRPFPLRALLLVASLAAAALADEPRAGGAAAPVGTPPAAGVDHAASLRALLAKSTYTPTAFEMTVGEPQQVAPEVVCERLVFPSPVRSADPERNDVVKARLYRTEAPEPALVVCLGGWRWDPATPLLAARIAGDSGVQTLLLELPFQGERTPKDEVAGRWTFSEDLERNTATFAQIAQDVSRAVDWMVRERKVDPKRIGILGTSLGGFAAADLYGMTDRFRCATVLLAGGDIASVVFNGNRITAKIRDAFVAQGLDEKAVRERLRPLDPVSWARSERKDGLLLVAAENDDVVPLATVKVLADAYGGARLVVMPGARHVDGAKLVAHFPEIVEHFRERLAPAAATAPATK